MTVYETLAVEPIICAAGPKTRLSGNLMPREVVDAMADASRCLVDIESLQAKASELISEATGAEAGLVTSGASAGLSLAAAACMTGLDISKMGRLPDTIGMRNEFVIPRNQRNAYDHAIRAVGARIVEAGLNDIGVGVGVRSVEPWEIASALTSNTAAIVYFAKPRSTPSLEEVIKIGRENSVPVIVDAAAELPPKTNLKKFISQGADAVVFSGGKALRGPQASGILCGKRNIIMAAALQMLDNDCHFETWTPPPSFIDKARLVGIPRHGIGRGFKVGKEEIVGLLTALTLYANCNQDVELSKYDRLTKSVTQALKDTPGIRTANLSRTDARPIPLAEITFANFHEVANMVNFVNRLKDGDPPIYLDESRLDEMVLQINPFNLQEDDLGVIVERIKEGLQAR